jgi:hypothetical protein
MNETKRDFLKKAAYVVPTILTLSATPAFAGTGSRRRSAQNKTAGEEAKLISRHRSKVRAEVLDRQNIAKEKESATKGASS